LEKRLIGARAATVNAAPAVPAVQLINADHDDQRVRILPDGGVRPKADAKLKNAVNDRIASGSGRAVSCDGASKSRDARQRVKRVRRLPIRVDPD
jgi:hypothetical protein